MTLEQFINKTGIRISNQPTDHNPHIEGSGRMDNWKVKLTAKKSAMDGLVQSNATMRLYFSKGVGHNGAEPALDEVLDCMASDAAGIENSRDFDDWCDEYGYDVDSRRAEKTYKTCQRQAERLKKFLGEEYYNELLWDLDRM